MLPRVIMVRVRRRMRRRSFKRVRRFKRRPGIRRGRPGKNAIVSALRALIETKRYYQDVTVAAFTKSTQIVQELVKVAQGTSDKTRIGKKITVVGITMKCVFKRASSTLIAADMAPTGHMWLVQSKTGKDPTSALLWLSVSDVPREYRNLDEIKDFKILAKKRWRMPRVVTDSAATVTMYTPDKHVNWFFPMKTSVVYDAADTAGTAYASGQIWAVWFSTASTTGITATYDMKVNFKDA